MKKRFDPEILYTYLKEKKWKIFLYTLNKEKNEIFSNPIALNATKYFLTEFLNSVNKNEPELYLEELDILILLHDKKHFVLEEDNFNQILKLRIYGQDKINPNKAYEFAKNYRQFDFVQKYCEDYESKLPLKVSHSYENEIDVTINKNISNQDFTIPLFKSDRERNFFNAIKERFPNYHTYPNVAISSIIDFGKIQSKLAPAQKEYFLKSIVDCVVFDPVDDYKPKYFFEIDSEFHDDEKRKIKDSWKDSFFSVAGKKLYRVRPATNRIDKEMFLNVISEIFK